MPDVELRLVLTPEQKREIAEKTIREMLSEQPVEVAYSLFRIYVLGSYMDPDFQVWVDGGYVGPAPVPPGYDYEKTVAACVEFVNLKAQ